jgi:hypothetical protein
MIEVHKSYKPSPAEEITKDELPSSYAELNSEMKKQNQYISSNIQKLRFLKSALSDLEIHYEDTPEYHELFELLSNMNAELNNYFDIVDKNKKLIRKAINKIPSDKRKQAQIALRKEKHGSHKCGGVCGRQIPAFKHVCNRSKCKASVVKSNTKIRTKKV